MRFGLCDLQRELAPRKRSKPMRTCVQDSMGVVSLAEGGMG